MIQTCFFICSHHKIHLYIFLSYKLDMSCYKKKMTKWSKQHLIQFKLVRLHEIIDVPFLFSTSFLPISNTMDFIRSPCWELLTFVEISCDELEGQPLTWTTQSSSLISLLQVGADKSKCPHPWLHSIVSLSNTLTHFLETC